MPFLKHKAYSPGRIIWTRFAQNRLALAGLIFLIFMVFLSVSGYFVIPDKSKHANEQHVEIATRKPGFKVMLLKVKKNTETVKQSFFNKLAGGKNQDYRFIPISSYKYHGEEIIVTEYTGELEDSAFVSKYPANVSEVIERKYVLGTDRFGRDMLSRIVLGSRVSLSVGIVAVLISLIIGISLGLTAGYFGGRVDQIIMWFISVVWSIPTLLMVIAISLALGKGFWQVFVAIGLTMWVDVARVVRGQVMSLKEKEFVEAARALGFPPGRIMFKHLLPNVTGPLVVIAAANFASAILMEAGLSFLGIGVQPPIPSWGGMIKDHYGFIIVDKAYLAIIPGIAIMLMVLAFMLMGNGFRDAIDKNSAK